MVDVNVPFAQNAGRRSPSADEKHNGFPCGAADQFLFNGLFWRIETEIRSVLVQGGVTPSDTNMGQLRDAIQNMIDAATGGGETSSYLLLDQAASRLPFYPAIDSSDGRINITSPATGTVRVPGGVDFLHRGIKPYTTVEMDFSTQPSHTYHVRWNPTDGYELQDLSDTGYNPSSLPEANIAFDSTYDDMLMARVVTNSSNVATITTLANLSELYIAEILTGTDPRLAGANKANFLFEKSLNWARKPHNYDFELVRAGFSGAVDQDFDFFATTENRDNPAPGLTTQIVIDRYGLNQVIMLDGATSLKALFNARA